MKFIRINILRTVGIVLALSFAQFTTCQIAEKINLNPLDPYDSSYPHGFIKAGDAVVFISESCKHGTELWRYYGNGDLKVFDIRPGDASSNPLMLVNVNDDIYFRADTSNSSSSKQLFVYDHVLDSVYKIAPLGWRAPSNLMEHDEKLYCSLMNSAVGEELWEITLTSSVQLTNHDLSFPVSPVSTGLGVCFGGSNAQGIEPWLYDGTSTFMISDIAPGALNSSPNGFILVNDTLYFKANDGVSGEELWKYDGTLSTLVGDINPSGSAEIGNMFTDGASLFFNATDPTNGNELRVFSNGVLSTFDINIGISNSDPSNFIKHGSSVFFVANDGVNGRELWKYESGIVSMVADINPGSANSLVYDPNFLPVGANLYFIAQTAAFDYGIWRTDGVGVTMEADFPVNSFIGDFRYVNGIFCFRANDAFGQPQIWEYDGTSYDYEEINPLAGSAPSTLVQIGDTVYFGAKNGVDGIEPFKYDGFSETFMGNTDDYSLGVNLNRIDTLNGEIYFNLGAPSPGPEFFHFDGQSVTQITDTNISFSFGENNFVSFWNGLENVILFTGSTALYGSELWEFNGTNVNQILDIWPGTLSGVPEDFLVYNNELIFSAQEPSTHNELWKYDGSSVTMLADIHTTGGSFPVPKIVYDNKAYLTANDGTHGRELWLYDGISCVMAADINPGSGGSNPANFFVYDNKLFFAANDGTNGIELHMWDGSTDVLLADINPGTASSNPKNFIELDGVLYFNAAHVSTGVELWSYSTALGLQLVADANPGTGSSAYHTPMVEFNNKLVFFGTYGTGPKLFESDGIVVNEVYTSPSLNLDIFGNMIVYQNNIFLTSDQNPYYPLYRYNGYNLIQVETDDSVEFIYPRFVHNDVLYGIAGYYCEQNSTQHELWKIESNICTPQFTTLNDTTCGNYSFEGLILDETGTYYYTHIDQGGCDSIITLSLVVQPVNSTVLNLSSCEFYNHYGDILTTSGSYNHVFTNQYGCDSTETLNLVINQPQESFVDIEGCDSVAFNGQWFNNSGNYDVVLSDVYGCDSIVHINAVVNLTEANIVHLGESLYAQPGTINEYQWLDCSNEFEPIIGETNDQFTPVSSGFYAVEITSDFCTDTSDCFEYIIDETGIGELRSGEILTFINNNNLLIETEIMGDKRIRIYDSNGKIVYTSVFAANETSVEIGDFASGIYLIYIQTNIGFYTDRIYFGKK